MKTFVPCLPDNAPFSPEQRAYLNGFLAGLFSFTEAGASAAGAVVPVALKPLLVLWGSQTGTSEKLAKRIAKEAGGRGYAATLVDMGQFTQAQLGGDQSILIVSSTYGDGEPPDNARAFWEHLTKLPLGSLSGARFSVCGLGDTNYPQFCAFGKRLDERFEQLGATRVAGRVDCDVEYEVAFANWLKSALDALDKVLGQGSGGASAGAQGNSLSGTIAGAGKPSVAGSDTDKGWSKSRPYPARLLCSDRLSAQGSAKDVRHVVFDLKDSGLVYEPGDALGVFPQNDPALVDALLQALGFKAEESVNLASGESGTLRELLLKGWDITRIPKGLLEHFAKRTNDAELQRVSAPDANGELTRFLWGRDVLDLVRAFPEVRFSPAEFFGFLRKLQPRLYSIASSPRRHPGEVHLTVGTVRYENLGRARGGVCSTYLADRATAGQPVPVFVHENTAFRPPADDVDLIMVGPGTGIAPFRAFLEERQARGAKGRNWLFFGDQRASTDFLYQSEIDVYSASGVLHTVDLAWSRDQGHKVYVQDRMRASAAELWRWLEGGAAFYVCGDASRMAKDVDAALHDVIAQAGGKSQEAAAAYVQALKASKRYRRDVY